MFRKELLSKSLEWPLHRVKVLEGHTGWVTMTDHKDPFPFSTPRFLGNDSLC